MGDQTLITAEKLLCMPEDGYRYELIAGELRRRELLHWRESLACSELLTCLGITVTDGKLGMLLPGPTGFLLARDPDTVRSPNIAFIHRDHLPSTLPDEVFWPGAPNLAVEVVSPGDTIREIDEKAKAWLAAGTSLVWVVNPAWRNVTVYRSPTDIKTVSEDAELTGEDVVPGFRCRVGDIFATA